jgi:general secretion pathway protein E
MLCPHCKQPDQVSGADLRKLGYSGTEAATVEVYQPQGCAKCYGHGYKGRAGIFELIPLDNAMAKLIHDGAGDLELERYARKLAPSIQQSALDKVLSGQTSLDEALRMTLKE